MRLPQVPTILALFAAISPCIAQETGVTGQWLGHCFTRNGAGFGEMEPNTLDCHKRVLRGEQVLVDGLITTDRYGRRSVPHSAHRKSKKFLAFLGCSFAFGEGVADSETLSSQVAEINTSWNVYNYGVPGFGPNNILQMLKSRDLPREIPESTGKFIYVWIPDHAIRAYGALSHGFVDKSPHYELDTKHELVLQGSFQNSQPLRYRLFSLLRRWNVGERLGFDIPPRITDSDFDLVIALLKELKKITTQAFPGSEFYLVIWPDGGPLGLRAERILSQAFSDGSIHVLDYMSLDLNHDQYNLPDRHPSPMAYKKLAAQISKDLKLDATR